jgi:hypothetical protein
MGIQRETDLRQQDITGESPFGVRIERQGSDLSLTLTGGLEHIGGLVFSTIILYLAGYKRSGAETS